jgi:phospholipid N-methyltransferase
MSKLFTFEGLKNLKQTGSLFRSSKGLANELTRTVDDSEDLVIVELGAGDGIITKRILGKISPSSELHAFEINESFKKHLNKIEDDRLKTHFSCVSELIFKFKMNQVDCVISCLPLANLDQPFKEQLISDIKHILKPGGDLIQYQYSINDMRFFKHNFSNMQTSFFARNIPPAFIYSCKG